MYLRTCAGSPEPSLLVNVIHIKCHVLAQRSILKTLTARDERPWGGGALILSPYVGSGPASTVHPKNIRNFKHPKKINEILATPKKISPILYLDLKKRP